MIGIDAVNKLAMAWRKEVLSKSNRVVLRNGCTKVAQFMAYPEIISCFDGSIRIAVTLPVNPAGQFDTVIFCQGFEWVMTITTEKTTGNKGYVVAFDIRCL